jgi:endoglucanase
MVKRAKKIAIAALAVLALCGIVSAQQPPAGSPVAKHGQLSVNGKWIVDKDGNPVQLRGMSFFWAQWSEGSRFYNSGVVNTLADDWKVSVVRVAYTNGQQSLCEAVIDAAIAKGIYVIADYHSHNANAEPSQAEAFFRAVATKYGDKPNIIYEIFNEPIEQSWSTIKTYATSMVNIIRSLDTKNIILIGTRDYSKRVDEPAASPVSGTNLAYVAHFYAAQEGHGGEIRNWIDVARGAGLAVFVSEFGTCEASGNGVISTEKTDEWFDYLDKNQISWVNWSVSDKSESASALKGGISTNGSGWSESNYTTSGLYIYRKLRYYASTTYTLTVNVPSGQGEVIRWPSSATNSYTAGTPVTLIAKPATGLEVAGWSGGGGASGSKDTVVVSMTQDRNVSVTFSQAGNLIKNGTFLGGVISPWQVFNSAAASTLPDAVLTAENSEGKITVTKAGTSLDHTYIYQSGISLKKGRNYKLSFSARGASARSVTAKVVVGSTNCMPPYEVSLKAGTANENFLTTFTMNESDAANAAVRFSFGGTAVGWFINNVSLLDVGPGTGIAAKGQEQSSVRGAWSISSAGGALKLRGPVDAGAKMSLYDTRGKVVRSVAAKDGITLNMTGIPAGSYLAVIKNRTGTEVYKSMVSFVR